MSVNALRREWASNIRGDVLAEMTVALALIPEAIAFSLIAGVDPMIRFCIAVVIAFAGGPPGMISAATGSMALVMVVLGRSHVWDQSAVAAIAKVREKYRQRGKSVYVTGLEPREPENPGPGVLVNGRMRRPASRSPATGQQIPDIAHNCTTTDSGHTLWK